MNVRWVWACKKFSAKQAEVKLESGLYFMVRDEGEDQVLAFRYVAEPDNMPMPNGVVPVKNQELLDSLDQWFESRSNNHG